MLAMVEKKLAKLKLVAAKFCKSNVVDDLNKAQAKRFKDVKQLTDWFMNVIANEDALFKQQFQRYEEQLNLWVETYHYIYQQTSPPYAIPIIDLLLEGYEKVEFYSKDPNKKLDIQTSIGLKLVVATSSQPQKKQLVATVKTKIYQMKAKKEAQGSSTQLNTQNQPSRIVVPSQPQSITQPTTPVVKGQPVRQKPQPPQNKREAEIPPTQPKDSRPIIERPLISLMTKPMRPLLKPRDQRKPISIILRQVEFVDNQNRKQTQVLLTQQLNNYMKNVLTKLIELAKIHTPNHTRLGDQFKYFSRNNDQRTNFQIPIDTRVKNTFYKIREPSKLTIFSQLRNAEEKEQEKLRIEDTKKRKEDEREIMEYVRGEPRKLETVAFQQEYIPTEILQIKINVVQAFMEMDPIYMDSEMLRKCYLS